MNAVKSSLLCLAVVSGVFGGEVMAQGSTPVVCVPPSYKDPQKILDCAIQLGADNEAALTTLGNAQAAKRACDAQAAANNTAEERSCRTRWSNNPGQLGICLTQAAATNASALQQCSAAMQAAQAAFNAALQAAVAKYNACVDKAPCITPIPVDGQVPPVKVEPSSDNNNDDSPDPVLELGLIESSQY